MQESIEDQLKKLIVETLLLEDVKPEEIDTDAPLFVEGLGLDSIDALELALAINKEFGVRTKEDDERNREHFFSIHTLAQFIRAEQAHAKESGDGEPGAQKPGDNETHASGAKTGEADDEGRADTRDE
ncbi:MAG: phosphopantetheine-binding protein [Nannocystaceae bacterium]